MNVLDFFRSRNRKSASKAKERLQIVVSHQRTEGSQPDFLPKLRQEMLDVISKYIEIEQDQIQVNLQREDNFSVLELNVTLPEQVEEVVAIAEEA